MPDPAGQKTLRMIWGSAAGRRCGAAIRVGACIAVAVGSAPSFVGYALGDSRTAENAKAGDAKTPPSQLQQLCANNAAAVVDARIAWQTARLGEIEAQVRQRLRELEAKQVEIATWLQKREEASRRATASVVAIYARMRPESAAAQLAAIDETIASAILGKLPSRAASVILNEMEPGRAARLTRGMVAPEATPAEKKS